jgi:hypothetical protein
MPLIKKLNVVNTNYFSLGLRLSAELWKSTAYFFDTFVYLFNAIACTFYEFTADNTHIVYTSVPTFLPFLRAFTVAALTTLTISTATSLLPFRTSIMP